ncbi:MAG: MBL fold metallo-hydrolase [Sphaerochaetaceae bacterium]
MLEYVFLGSNGSLQDEQSGNTSLLIRSGKGSILVDASVGLSVAVLADIDALFLTHGHIDHVYGLPSLVHQLWLSGRTRPLEIVFHEGMDGLVNGFLDLFLLREKKGMFPLVLKHSAYHLFGDMAITSFKTDHTDSSIGLVVESRGKKLVYTSDTRPGKVPSESMLHPDVLIHEASGLSKDEELLVGKGHSSGRDAALAAQEIGASILVLCHLPSSSEAKEDILKEASEVFGNTHLPKVGQIMEIDENNG